MAERLEDRADFVDVVAQAVIDKIEERNRLARLVEMVAARVIQIQTEEAKLQAIAAETGEITRITPTPEDATHGSEL